MAYQAKRKKKFIEDFELVDENGNVLETLHIQLDADDMLAKLNRKYTELCRTLAETTEIKRKAHSNEEMGDCVEKLGNAVIQMFEAVFGEEDTKTIISFYDNRYIEMCQEVVPFIKNVVIPRIGKIKKENQKITLSSYHKRRR